MNSSNQRTIHYVWPVFALFLVGFMEICFDLADTFLFIFRADINDMYCLYVYIYIYNVSGWFTLYDSD